MLFFSSEEPTHLSQLRVEKSCLLILLTLTKGEIDLIKAFCKGDIEKIYFKHL